MLPLAFSVFCDAVTVEAHLHGVVPALIVISIHPQNSLTRRTRASLPFEMGKAYALVSLHKGNEKSADIRR